MQMHRLPFRAANVVQSIESKSTRSSYWCDRFLGMQMVAAYLMATEHLDVDTAVSSIAALRSIVQPNEGFLMQLRVWQEMGCRVDESHPYVRQKTLEALSEQTLAGDTVQKRALAVPSDRGSSQVRIVASAGHLDVQLGSLAGECCSDPD